jgi:hypothetical protein
LPARGSTNHPNTVLTGAVRFGTIGSARMKVCGSRHRAWKRAYHPPHNPKANALTSRGTDERESWRRQALRQGPKPPAETPSGGSVHEDPARGLARGGARPDQFPAWAPRFDSSDSQAAVRGHGGEQPGRVASRRSRSAITLTALRRTGHRRGTRSDRWFDSNVQFPS